MGRNHHERLAEIHGFADGLKSGSRSIGMAPCHLTEELLVIKVIKTESIIHNLDRSLIGIVPEKPERDIRMFTMPGIDLLRKTGIEHISQYIAAIPELWTFAISKNLRTKQWRDDLYPAVIRHWPE